jgi:hypothetical protein
VHLSNEKLPTGRIEVREMACAKIEQSTGTTKQIFSNVADNSNSIPLQLDAALVLVSSRRQTIHLAPKMFSGVKTVLDPSYDPETQII